MGVGRTGHKQAGKGGKSRQGIGKTVVAMALLSREREGHRQPALFKERLVPVVLPSVIVVLLGLHTGSLPARLPPPECVAVAANIHADPDIRASIQALLQRSRTIRTQCGRIGAAERVIVRVALTPGASDADTRARSVARRFRSGLLVVDVQLPVASADFVELLAHELEHVVEMIEGVDLRRLAGESDGLVTFRRTDGAFESVRARAAGLAAAAEAPPDADPVAGAFARGATTAARATWRAVRSIF